MTASRKRKRPRERYFTDEDGVMHKAKVPYCSRCDGTGLEPPKPKRKARR